MTLIHSRASCVSIRAHLARSAVGNTLPVSRSRAGAAVARGARASWAPASCPKAHLFRAGVAVSAGPLIYGGRGVTRQAIYSRLRRSLVNMSARSARTGAPDRAPSDALPIAIVGLAFSLGDAYGARNLLLLPAALPKRAPTRPFVERDGRVCVFSDRPTAAARRTRAHSRPYIVKHTSRSFFLLTTGSEVRTQLEPAARPVSRKACSERLRKRIRR